MREAITIFFMIIKIYNTNKNHVISVKYIVHLKEHSLKPVPTHCKTAMKRYWLNASYVYTCPQKLIWPTLIFLWLCDMLLQVTTHDTR